MVIKIQAHINQAATNVAAALSNASFAASMRLTERCSGATVLSWLHMHRLVLVHLSLAPRVYLPVTI